MRTAVENIFVKEYYLTPNGSKIRVISGSKYTVAAKVIDSPIKSQIGLTKVFILKDLVKIGEDSKVEEFDEVDSFIKQKTSKKYQKKIWNPIQ